MNELLLSLPFLLAGQSDRAMPDFEDEFVSETLHFWQDDEWEDEFAPQIVEPTPAERGALPANLMGPGDATRWFAQDNGNIATSQMTAIEKGAHYLRKDAALAYKAMQKALKNDLGSGFTITDSYRDLATQQSLYISKPGFAATPGTSNHGWGMALDVNVDDPRVRDWLRKHGKRFGFHELRHSDGSEFEPWHWDFKADGTFESASKVPEEVTPAARKRFKIKDFDPADVAVEEADTLSTIPGVMMTIYGERHFKPQTAAVNTSSKKVPGFIPQEYQDLFARASKRYGVPVKLLALIAQKESGFDPNAQSPAGALGMMQIMPQYHDLGDYFDAKESVMYGAKYIGSLIKNYNGSVRDALAAYNAGGGNIEAGYGYADDIIQAWRG